MFKILVPFFLIISIMANGQGMRSNDSLMAIDHVPVVVNNPDSIKNILSGVFHFQIKEGRAHEGIKNCFVKFRDGSYLELTCPVDSLQATGKYYTDFLQHRQGGTVLALSVNNANLLMNDLERKSIAFETDSNKIWTTVSPKGADLFFIEYADKSWKDAERYTKHPNTSLSLKSVYLISANTVADLQQYQSFGMKQGKAAYYSGIPCQLLTAGRSNLYLLDSSKAKKISARFSVPAMKGICGFEIKVGSLSTLNALLPKTGNIVFEKHRTTCYLNEYNLFFTFTE